MFRKEPETPATPSAPATPAPDLSALSASAQPPKEKPAEAIKNVVPPAMLSPESIAFMNSSIAAAVREAVSSLGPIMVQMEQARRAPTPEQQTAQAREERERANLAQDLNEQRLGKERLQERCPHKYPSGQYAISVIHNFPDRQARGTCHLCGCWFHPREWEILAPTRQNPRGVPRIRDAHPMYKVILEIEALKS